VTNRTGLTGDSAALDMRVDIELAVQLNRTERLLHYHAAGFSAEKLGQCTTVNGHFSGALAQINPRARRLSTSGTVKGIGGCD
jgi:hypothetical protein